MTDREKRSKSELKRLAKRWLGIEVLTWAPGDGYTRYKFIPQENFHDDYDHTGIHTAKGLSAAWDALEAMQAASRLIERRETAKVIRQTEEFMKEMQAKKGESL